MPKILLVEDEDSLAKALAAKLRQAGFAVAGANNGKEALRILAGQAFDVVLLDLLMPEMDGFAFLHQFRRSDRRTPVAVLSNLGQPEDMAHAKSLGAHVYLIKANTPLEAVVACAKRLAAPPSQAAMSHST